MHSDEQHVRPLARLVAEKTGGNPFFTIQFLTELAAESLLSFDAGIAAWTLERRTHRRQGLHGQHRAIDGGEAAAPARCGTGSVEGARLPRQHRGLRDARHCARELGGGDPLGVPGRCASGPRDSPRRGVPIRARPRSRGGVCTDSAGVATRDAPAHRTPAPRGERRWSPRPSASSPWSTN